MKRKVFMCTGSFPLKENVWSSRKWSDHYSKEEVAENMKAVVKRVYGNQCGIFVAREPHDPCFDKPNFTKDEDHAHRYLRLHDHIVVVVDTDKDVYPWKIAREFEEKFGYLVHISQCDETDSDAEEEEDEEDSSDEELDNSAVETFLSYLCRPSASKHLNSLDHAPYSTDKWLGAKAKSLARQGVRRQMTVDECRDIVLLLSAKFVLIFMSDFFKNDLENVSDFPKK